MGAVLELRSAAGIQRREVRAGSSYLSQNSLTQTFGVPADPGADDEASTVEIRIRWPREGRLTLPQLPVGRRMRVVR